MQRILGLFVVSALVAACSNVPPGAIDETRSLELGDLERTYRLVVPADLDGPIPLVVVFHGFGGDPQQVRDLSAFDVLAESEGFAVAFPMGAGLVPAWRTDAAFAAPDVAFARRVVEDVAGVIDLDRDRVFAVGMSNGGGMAGRLGCDASDVFAAVGAVAAAHGLGSCGAERPVPVIAFHGDADRIVPIDGIPFIAQDPREWASNRARDNGCDPDPAVTAAAQDVERLAWAGCEADVVFYLVADGRHGWPGSDRAGRSGDSTTSIDASALVWEFFTEHPMP